MYRDFSILVTKLHFLSFNWNCRAFLLHSIQLCNKVVDKCNLDRLVHEFATEIFIVKCNSVTNVITLKYIIPIRWKSLQELLRDFYLRYLLHITNAYVFNSMYLTLGSITENVTVFHRLMTECGEFFLQQFTKFYSDANKNTTLS